MSLLARRSQSDAALRVVETNIHHSQRAINGKKSLKFDENGRMKSSSYDNMTSPIILVAEDILVDNRIRG